MIDLASRQRILEEQRTKKMVDQIGSKFIEAVGQKGSGSAHTITMEIEEKKDPDFIALLGEFGSGFEHIYRAIKDIKFELPRLQRVEGTVSIDSQPPVTVKNFSDMGGYFQSLEARISQLATAISMMKPVDIKFPKFEIPKTELDLSSLEEKLSSLEETIVKISKKETTSKQMVVSVDNFPPQLTPQPVTNININGLRGPVKATAMSVDGTAIALPTTALENRRSIIIFNNDMVNTVYIGGSTVTAATGLPILAQTYSPAMDLSTRTTLYGITSTGTLNVRVFEASMDAIGS